MCYCCFFLLQLLNAQNINQIFQLLFNVIVNSETGVTRQYAVDLFTDLLQLEPRVQQSLIKSVLPCCRAS